MDSIRVSEAPDSGSIPDEATFLYSQGRGTGDEGLGIQPACLSYAVKWIVEEVEKVELAVDLSPVPSPLSL